MQERPSWALAKIRSELQFPQDADVSAKAPTTPNLGGGEGNRLGDAHGDGRGNSLAFLLHRREKRLIPLCSRSRRCSISQHWFRCRFFRGRGRFRHRIRRRGFWCWHQNLRKHDDMVPVSGLVDDKIVDVVALPLG